MLPPVADPIRKPIARHLDFPLRPGRRQAALVVEDAQCEIYKSFDEARAYLTDNIDWILQNFSEADHISREDVMIVSCHEDRICSNAECRRSLAPLQPSITRWWSLTSPPELLSSSTCTLNRLEAQGNRGEPGAS